jgi:hypothetical protein
LGKLLTPLQSTLVERDRFVSHLYQARREYRRTCEPAGKSGKQIGRCVISTCRLLASKGIEDRGAEGEAILIHATVCYASA